MKIADQVRSGFD